MKMVTDEMVEAACRAMCKSNGTGQCAPICLSHFSIRITQGGVCPEATRVYGRRAKAALEAAEVVRRDEMIYDDAAPADWEGW
jgi:hypothetical protein